MTGLQLFTLVHTLISLVGILAGFVVVFGFISGKQLSFWTPTFLWSTLLTSITGFFFPFTGFKPSYVLGTMSILVLAFTFYALYSKRLAGGWRSTYVITSVIALWFNFFVLIAQCFMKVPALEPYNGKPPFLVAETLGLILFLFLGYLATKRFRLTEVALRTA